MTPDPWQRDLLRQAGDGDRLRAMLNCSRQAGKSSVASALALRRALVRPDSLVLLLSASQRQSGELFRERLLPLYRALGRPVATVRETATELVLANGSRLVSLPESEPTIRGFSKVNLLIIDEAARVSDALYRTVRPMLSVSRGGLVALSTPGGKRGWFFSEWTGRERWLRVRVTADEVSRIDPEFLDEERRVLGPRWFASEYCCSFEDCVGAVFRQEDIDDALCDDVPSMFGRPAR